MSQPFAHLELRSPDLKQAETFYAKLFGWTMKPYPGSAMPYTLFDTGRIPGGGMMQAEPGGTPHWVPYVVVNDVAAAVKQAVALGAKVRQDVTEIPGMGKIAVLADPAGSPIGLVHPDM
jgi:hypothetical protein